MKFSCGFLSRFFSGLSLTFTSVVALANIPGLEVNGNTISWTATGYMQVQNAEDFVTVCEGNLFSCAVEAGTYIVIDHGAGIRQEGVLVEETDRPIIRPFTLVERRSTQASAFPLNKYMIRAECPGGMIPIGGGCEGVAFCW